VCGWSSRNRVLMSIRDGYVAWLFLISSFSLAEAGLLMITQHVLSCGQQIISLLLSSPHHSPRATAIAIATASPPPYLT
jgi:hypothetical protein